MKTGIGRYSITESRKVLAACSSAVRSSTSAAKSSFDRRSSSSACFLAVISRAMPIVPITAPRASKIGILIVSAQVCSALSAGCKGSSTDFRLPVRITSKSSSRYFWARSRGQTSKSVFPTRSSGLTPQALPNGSLTTMNRPSLSFNQAMSGILSRMAARSRTRRSSSSRACWSAASGCLRSASAAASARIVRATTPIKLWSSSSDSSSAPTANGPMPRTVPHNAIAVVRKIASVAPCRPNRSAAQTNSGRNR